MPYRRDTCGCVEDSKTESGQATLRIDGEKARRSFEGIVGTQRESPAGRQNQRAPVDEWHNEGEGRQRRGDYLQWREHTDPR